jgi:zinc transport system substrate-binding protein
MADLEGADLFLAAGVPFELGLVGRIRALPKAPIVAGPRAFGQDAEGHHGAGHNHHHHETDPHTWLDPAQASALADTISGYLQALAPEGSADIRQRHDVLIARLAEVDAQVADLLAPFAGRRFIVFHPAFGHFAAAYGLVQVPVESGGHEPGPRHLATVIEEARDAGAASVVVQPQFSRKAAETVAAAIGAEIVVLDPLAADYPANLLAMATTLADRFAAEDRPKEGS